MRLELGGGSYVEVDPAVKEMDMVTVVSPNGKNLRVRWGSVIAMTNGEAVRLLKAQR